MNTQARRILTARDMVQPVKPKFLRTFKQISLRKNTQTCFVYSLKPNRHVKMTFGHIRMMKIDGLNDRTCLCLPWPENGT